MALSVGRSLQTLLDVLVCVRDDRPRVSTLSVRSGQMPEDLECVQVHVRMSSA